MVYFIHHFIPKYKPNIQVECMKFGAFLSKQINGPLSFIHPTRQYSYQVATHYLECRNLRVPCAMCRCSCGLQQLMKIFMNFIVDLKNRHSGGTRENYSAWMCHKRCP